MAITTNTEVKVLLKITGTSDDTLLTILIANAEAAIDRQAHRHVAAVRI